MRFMTFTTFKSPENGKTGSRFAATFTASALFGSAYRIAPTEFLKVIFRSSGVLEFSEQGSGRRETCLPVSWVL